MYTFLICSYKKLQEEYKRIDILMTEIPSILDEDAAERKEELEADYDSCLSSGEEQLCLCTVVISVKGEYVHYYFIPVVLCLLCSFPRSDC